MTFDQLSREDFANLQPAALVIRHQGRDLPLEVAELRDIPGHSPRSAPFAVTFKGPREPLLPQGIYALIHPVHGQLDLFIVPIGRDQNCTEYELIFN